MFLSSRSARMYGSSYRRLSSSPLVFCTTATLALRLFSFTATKTHVFSAAAASASGGGGDGSNSRSLSSSSRLLPSSLSGIDGPICKLVPPGICQFKSEEFISVPLLERVPISSTSSVLKFGLPDPTKPLNLSTCACILAKADIGGDNDSSSSSSSSSSIIRPYTPISTNQMIGSFDLLIKDYGTNGQMSNYLCNTIQIGDNVDFKHIDFNVKIQASTFINNKDLNIIMIAGGTGITPMIQALHAILGNDVDNQDNEQQKPNVTLLYGSKVSNDILGKELLDLWSKKFSNRFKVVYVLSEEKEEEESNIQKMNNQNENIDYQIGHIDMKLIEKYIPSSTSKEEDILIFVCGPPPMYDSICGPRDTKEITGILNDIGYTSEQVYKF